MLFRYSVSHCLSKPTWLVCGTATGMQSALLDAIKASSVETVLMLLRFHVEPELQVREWHEEYVWNYGYDRYTAVLTL